MDLTKFEYNSETFKIPHLHETWTWEGDESVLPYKWAEIISKSEILHKQGKGVLYYINNDIYIGDFKNNKKNGKGRYYSNDGNIF